MMTPKTLLLGLAFTTLVGCAPDAATDDLVRTYEQDGRWLEMSLDAEDSSVLTLTYDDGRERSGHLTLDAQTLVDGDRRTEAALRTFTQQVQPDFLEDARSSLLDDRDDDVSRQARVVLLDVAVDSVPQRGENRLGMSTSFGMSASLVGTTPSYECSGWLCTCTGDVDCNDMFDNGCDTRPSDLCIETLGVLTCYCW